MNCHWIYTVILGKLMDFLNDNIVAARLYFTPIHLQKFYVERFGYSAGTFPVTEDVSSRTVAIPFYTSLTEEDQKYVVDVIKEALRKA